MSTRHGVAEPEVGQLVFQAVGTLAFDDLDDCAAFPAPKGYARHVACSSKYGVTCFADGGGVRVIETAALVAHAASTKEKMPREQLCPPDAFATIAIPDVSCVAFSPCETILAVCVGPQVRFLETRALVACAREPTAAPTPEPFAVASLGADESSDRVRDFLWQPGGAGGGLAYLALAGPEDSDDGKLFVGTAGADDGVDIADRVVAVAMAPARRRKSRRRVHPGRRVGDGGGRRRLRQAQGQGPRRGDARRRDREDRRRRRRGGGGRGGTRVWPAAGTRAHRRGEGARRPGPAPRPRARRRHPDGFELLGRRLPAAGARVHAAGGDVRHRRRRDDGAARALPARADRATVGRGARLAPKGLG